MYRFAHREEQNLEEITPGPPKLLDRRLVELSLVDPRKSALQTGLQAVS